MLSGFIAPLVPLLLSAAGGRVYVQEDVTARLVGDFEPGARVLVPAHAPWSKTIEPFVTALTESKVSVLLVPTEDDPGYAGILGESLGVEHIGHVVNSPWLRDFGPLRVEETRDGHAREVWLDVATHPDLPRDDALTSKLSARLAMPTRTVPWWIEGGGFASNGAGMCVTATGYLELRNIDEDTRPRLQRALGCRVLIVIPTPRSEPTRHADLVVQFTGPDAAVVATSQETTAPGASDLQLGAWMLRAGARSVDADLTLFELDTEITNQGTLRSPVNGLRTETHFFAPVYAGQPPAEVRAAMGQALGEISVVPIDAAQPAAEGGALHCLALGL